MSAMIEITERGASFAENCENGWFDPRNKYAAETSKKIIDYFKEIDYPY